MCSKKFTICTCYTRRNINLKRISFAQWQLKSLRICSKNFTAWSFWIDLMFARPFTFEARKHDFWEMVCPLFEFCFLLFSNSAMSPSTFWSHRQKLENKNAKRLPSPQAQAHGYVNHPFLNELWCLMYACQATHYFGGNIFKMPLDLAKAKNHTL